MILPSERVWFKYTNGFKVVRMSENMLFDVLRKTITIVIEGSKNLLDPFHHLFDKE